MTLLFVLCGWWLETSVLEGGGPALAERICRICGWPMPLLSNLRDGEAPTRPDALF